MVVAHLKTRLGVLNIDNSVFILLHQPCFPELVEKIESAIAVLGGRVVPKLNWSTPKVSHMTVT